MCASTYINNKISVRAPGPWRAHFRFSTAWDLGKHRPGAFPKIFRLGNHRPVGPERSKGPIIRATARCRLQIVLWLQSCILRGHRTRATARFSLKINFWQQSCALFRSSFPIVVFFRLFRSFVPFVFSVRLFRSLFR